MLEQSNEESGYARKSPLVPTGFMLFSKIAEINFV